MKKSLIAAIVTIPTVIICCVILTLQKSENKIEYNSDYQHENETEADPNTGEGTLPSDFQLDESFVTHLPLVVVDLQGNEIPNVYAFSGDGTKKVYSKEGLINPDPWTSMNIRIIDNENGQNHLTDDAVIENNGLIKLRGMTSRGFDKKQYGIRFMDGDAELELSVLGMEADEDWVLSNSLLDLSGIRNYMAMNIGRMMFPYTSEVRFCEVVFKDGDTYTYQGLYLFEESIKQAEGRVNIADYDEGAASLSYIVCRDRYDETKLTLSTWASDSQLCYGYFGVKYPKEELLTDSTINKIQSELSQIEYCLYGEDYNEFLKYDKYIDVESFVDYFIINEFFMNYDAGNNSTYYYKNSDGRLAMGPLWDYDNCLDNYSLAAADYESLPFASQPWFERLVQDPDFQERVVERYRELRKGILSDRYINNFIDETIEYLGKARERDYVRWKESYENKHLLPEVENADGIVIDRNSGNVSGEIQRVKDILSIHSEWMDKNLKNELSKFTSDEVLRAKRIDRTGIVAISVIAFITMVILLMRVVKGEYR